MKVQWRLKNLMLEKGVNSATELARMLDEAGVHISTSQVARITNEMPSRISTNVFIGILKVLGCNASDILVVEHDGEPISDKPKKPSNVKPIPTKTDDTDTSTLLGPSVRTFPIKGDK